MTDTDNRLFVCILDALDSINIYQFGLDWVAEQFEKRGEILGISTLPHTALSNPMIWGGVVNDDKFWVEKVDDDAEGLNGEVHDEWVDPAMYFDREKGQPVEGARGFSRELDYAEESFIWDDLYAAGYDARALQVPIVLPPYSYRTRETLDEAWFPDTTERMATHIREKPALCRQELATGAEFLATSIQMPDKWLHGIGEGKCEEDWVRDEADVMDAEVQSLIEYCEDEGISWLIFGDHGSPTLGAMKKSGYLLPRHRKESIIISSDDIEPPTYTDELYPWFLDLFDVEPAGEAVLPDDEIPDELTADDMEDIETRLEGLGYM